MQEYVQKCYKDLVFLYLRFAYIYYQSSPIYKTRFTSITNLLFSIQIETYKYIH